jgi:hypothetical protein
VAGSWPRAPGAFWDKMTTNDDLRRARGRGAASFGEGVGVPGGAVLPADERSG